jgi:hypothetical protein
VHQTADDAPVVNVSDDSAREMLEQRQTVAAADIVPAPSEPASADTKAAVGGSSEGADGAVAALDSRRPASTPIPRGPFSALPRRLTTKHDTGGHDREA